MGEVEAQLVGPHGRSRLPDVGAEPLPQSGVQQVGRRVVAHGREAGHVVHLRLDVGAGRQAVRALQLDRLVVPDPVDVGHLRTTALPADLAGVSDLAAPLRVEGALLQLDQGAPVVALDGEQAGLGAQLLVADEARGRCRRGEAEHGAVVVLRAVRVRDPHPRARPLLLHQLLEALVVDRESLFGQQLPGQVVRKAVGVVEPEGVLRVDPRGSVLVRVADQVPDHLHAPVEGAAEALLLVHSPAEHGVALGGQLGIGGGQQIEGAVGELLHERRFQAD